MNYAILYYLTSAKENVAADWLKSLRDPIAKAKISKRISRCENGNFGDHKPCRDGVWELRIDQGPGYRVYYAIDNNQVVLLLCGGDKKTQDEDIETAIHYWKDWNARGPQNDEDDEKQPDA